MKILVSLETTSLIKSLSLNFLSNKLKLDVSKFTTAVETLSDIDPAVKVVCPTSYLTVILGTTYRNVASTNVGDIVTTFLDWSKVTNSDFLWSDNKLPPLGLAAI